MSFILRRRGWYRGMRCELQRRGGIESTGDEGKRTYCEEVARLRRRGCEGCDARRNDERRAKQRPALLGRTMRREQAQKEGGRETKRGTEVRGRRTRAAARAFVRRRDEVRAARTKSSGALRASMTTTSLHTETETRWKRCECGRRLGGAGRGLSEREVSDRLVVLSSRCATTTVALSQTHCLEPYSSPKRSSRVRAGRASCWFRHEETARSLHSRRGVGVDTARVAYERGFSFFSFQRARRPTPETLTTLKRTPGMSLRGGEGPGSATARRRLAPVDRSSESVRRTP